VGANPVDRGKPGSKLHLVCDGGGLPLTAVVTAANVGDTTMFQAVLDNVPPVRGSEMSGSGGSCGASAMRQLPEQQQGERRGNGARITGDAHPGKTGPKRATSRGRRASTPETELTLCGSAFIPARRSRTAKGDG
jgi:hypothetical protein